MAETVPQPTKSAPSKAADDLVDPVALGEDESDAPRRAFVQSLERGLSVVRAFDADHPQLTLSDVARVTGLDRAATRRFLYTFVALGYMRLEGRLFSLRPKLLELGYAYLSSLRLPADRRAASARALGRGPRILVRLDQ